MYEFFEDDKRYYIVTEYLYPFTNLPMLGSAKEESCLTKSLPEENSLKEMQPF